MCGSGIKRNNSRAATVVPWQMREGVPSRCDRDGQVNFNNHINGEGKMSDELIKNFLSFYFSRVGERS